MSGSLALFRRCAARRSCICAPRMSALEDGMSSLDKLRSMQQSIMRRRRGAAREISTSSDTIDLDTSVPEILRPESARTEASKNREKKSPPRKRGRPRKGKTQEKANSVSALPLYASTHPVANAVVPDVAVLSKDSKVGAPARNETVSSSTGAVFNFDDILSGGMSGLNIAETPGKFDCFLEKRDGSLPLLNRNVRKELAPAKPIFIRIPQLCEFTAAVTFKKSQWFLPRVNSSQPIEFFASNSEPAVDRDFSGDCDKILEALNPQQITAVTSDANKACLVLAGPGSGKTRVLTHRAAFLVRRYNLQPYRILAVTFTNKAAEEMKNRLRKLLMQSPRDRPWSSFDKSDFVVGTFHSICARFLRVYGAAIGIDPNFQICDSSDARQVVQLIMKASAGSVSSESVANKVSIITAMISKLKNNGDTEMEKQMPAHFFREVTQYRALYDKKLRDMNQLDFDDLLLETRRMLDESPDVLQELQNRYLHILVDEWQDTNSVQFDIVTTLAKQHRNLFVVGDADQSIYKFRGADIRNVTRFTEMFPDALTVALEENYRSTGCIVNSAQAVIEGNRGRPNKPMRTSNAFGSPVVVCKANDGRAEASYIVSRVTDLLRSKKIKSLSEVAVLYRMNAQSRLVEEAFINASMPYRLVAGTRFYERQEVKDILSYVRLLVNPVDDMALLRAINTPPRGIGKKTVEVLEEIAASQGVSILEALENLCGAGASSESAEDIADSATLRKGALKKLAEFLFIIDKLRGNFGSIIRRDGDEQELNGNAADVIEQVIQLTDYKTFLEKRSASTGSKEINKFEERWRNLEELQAAATRYPTLTDFMESVSLLSKPSDSEAEVDPATGLRQPQAVSLMTMHAGKGLEFTAVFIAGVEDGLLPMVRRGSEEGEDDSIAEERRLAYVGMTRAKQHLTLSWRARSLIFGSSNGPYWRDSKPSRFLQDIPISLVKKEQCPSPRFAGRLSRNRTGEPNVQPTTQWHVGDSVRCAKHGRGTIVTKGAQPTVREEAEVEVLFSNGKRRFLNPIRSSLELLYSPSSSK